MSNVNIDKGIKDGVLTSGANHSYWIDSAEPVTFNSLRNDLETDVLIIGAGISGLSVAYCLSKAGVDVTVIDDGAIGSGETGRTTAHITNALDDRYYEIISKLGEENAKLAASSHTAAIDFVERISQEENINCEFKRLDGYLFLHPSDELKSLQKELDATHLVGLDTDWLENIPGVTGIAGPCIRFKGQGQFHPMKYLQGLAKCILKYGGQIYTETHATKITEGKVMSNDFTIKANHIVVATNTPVNDLVTMHTKQHPYRTYVIGGLIPKGTLRSSLWWDTGNMKSEWISDPYHYVRLESYDDYHDLLIAGGEDHKTGQIDKDEVPQEQRFQNLENWTRAHFPMMQEVIYHWSGQVMEPVDLMGFIGKNPGDKNIYISTGDSGNGMTHGTIAGMLIADLILQKDNEWAKLYDPSRITLKAAPEFIQEAANMAVQYLDYFKPGDVKSIQELKLNEGAIVNMGAKKVAVYKDENNMLHAYTAICPHLGCVLQWNNAEKSFDCPCHGSRFTCEGNVVNGPATSNLEKVNLRKPQ